MKRRVALISHSPHLCGAEKMLSNLAILLSRGDAFEPVVFIPNSTDGPLGNLLSSLEIEWLSSPGLEWFLIDKSEEISDYMGRALKTANVYRSMMEHARIDVVVINTLTNIEGALAAILAGLPYVVWVHGILDAGLLGYTNSFANLCEDIILENSESIACCSEWTEMHYLHRVCANKILTIPNWTDLDDGSTTKVKKNHISMLTTVEEKKGIRTAIDIMQCLDGTDITLQIYGDGRDKEYFQEMVLAKGLSKKINFNDRVTDVNKVYDESKIIIFPSFMESFGMVAIESMSRGTPVIASRVGGLANVIEHGVNGILCEVGNPQEFAREVTRLLEDEKFYQSIKKNGLKTVNSKFSPSAAGPAFARLLNKACRSRDQTKFSFQIASRLFNIFESRDLNRIVRAKQMDQIFRAQTKLLTVISPREYEKNPLIPAFDTKRSYFEGLMHGAKLRGWALDSETANPCSIDVYVDSELIGVMIAELFRQDLLDAGISNPTSAFLCPLPSRFCDGRSHKFELLFSSNGQSLLGSPMTLETSRFNSWIEGITCGLSLTGWIEVLESNNDYNISVIVDGEIVTSTLAAVEREDLKSAGFQNGRGFSIKLPPHLFDGADHIVVVNRSKSGEPLENSGINITFPNFLDLTLKKLALIDGIDTDDLIAIADFRLEQSMKINSRYM